MAHSVDRGEPAIQPFTDAASCFSSFFFFFFFSSLFFSLFLFSFFEGASERHHAIRFRGSGQGCSFREPQKQDVFGAAPMDGFTAVPKRATLTGTATLSNERRSPTPKMDDRLHGPAPANTKGTEARSWRS
ncbi:MAG TPA: hypothetical protein VNQ81_07140 [Povalibacter sp.]|nr:hypothetical protein [Povalibacter sp.]